MPFEKPLYVFGRPDHNMSERSTLALVSLLAKECAHFIDVGAHEGIFTFVVAQSGNSGMRLHWFEPDDALSRRLHGCPGKNSRIVSKSCNGADSMHLLALETRYCEVESFESLDPVPRTAVRRLQEKLAINNIAARGNKMAVSSHCGTATFYRNLSDDASGSLTDDFAQIHATRKQDIETVTLGEYFAGNQIEDALVKVDVEGHGGGVWEGARTCIEKIKYLVMEIIDGESRANLPARIVAETGWHAYYLRDFDVVHSPDGSFDYVEPFWNWLFCRQDSRELSQKFANTKFCARMRT